jgi:hypothetical protein
VRRNGDQVKRNGKLYNEEFHNKYSSPNIIRAIKSRRKRFIGHARFMRETGNAYKIVFKDLKGREHLGGLVIDRRMILKWALRNCFEDLI